MHYTRVYGKKTVNLYGVILIISILSFIMFLYFSLNFESHKYNKDSLILLSWLAILVGIYILFTWYKLTGKIFSLYTIFIMFFFLFNLGQPLMWAFGIHQVDEIGNTGLYTLGKPSYSSITYTQVITLICIIMFHFGAVVCLKPRNNKSNIKNKTNKYLTKKSLLYVSILLSVFVIPVSLYNSIYDFIFSQSYSYRALYYDDSKTSIVLFNLLNRMFFPCLLGILIGSNYNKRARIFVYVIFLIYMITNLLSGDRGSWIYNLVILIFLSHTFYKKIRWKQILFGTFCGLLFLYFVDVIVEIRSTTGISLANIKDSLTLSDSPIVDFIFEMGRSMRPTIVLIEQGWDIWPYMNSYIISIVGLLPESIIHFLGIPYDMMTSWFSQEYLGISYGAGFSIIAESLVNFGPLLAPLVMIVLGYILSSLTFLNKNSNLEENALKVFIAASTMSVFVSMVRGTLQHSLNEWVYGVIPIVILIYLMKLFLKSKMRKYISKEV